MYNEEQALANFVIERYLKFMPQKFFKQSIQFWLAVIFKRIVYKNWRVNIFSCYQDHKYLVVWQTFPRPVCKFCGWHQDQGVYYWIIKSKTINLKPFPCKIKTSLHLVCILNYTFQDLGICTTQTRHVCLHFLKLIKTFVFGLKSYIVKTKWKSKLCFWLHTE